MQPQLSNWIIFCACIEQTRSIERASKRTTEYNNFLSHGVKKKIFGNPRVRLVTTTALMPMKRSWCRVAVDSFISRPFVNMVPVSFLFVGKIIIIRGYINISKNFVGNITHYSPNFNSNMIILAFSKRLPRYCWMQNSNSEGIQWLSRVFANQAISKLK